MATSGERPQPGGARHRHIDNSSENLQHSDHGDHDDTGDQTFYSSSGRDSDGSMKGPFNQSFNETRKNTFSSESYQTDSSPERSGVLPEASPRRTRSGLHPRPGIRSMKKTSPGRNNTPEKKPSPKYTPVLHPDKHKETLQRPSGGNDEFLNPIIIVIIVLFGFALVVIYAYNDNTHNDDTSDIPTYDTHLSPRTRMVNEFVQKISHTKHLFPGQSARFWATLSAAVKSVMKSDKPRQPGIILLAGTSSSKQTMECVEGYLSTAISDAYQSERGIVRLTVDSKLLDLSHGDLKLEIDNEFKAGLGAGSHVAVLRELHKVPGKPAMMFHAYCDNESAPFKDAVIVFTFVLNMSDGETQELDDIKIAQLVEEQLQDMWQNDIGVDNTMALLSRVANNIAVVRNESLKALKEMNCA